jgi:hypothetical protein
MPFVKGCKKSPLSGRKKGQLTTDVAQIRGMVAQALHNAGGVEYLVQQAKDNPQSFLSLLGKVLPKEINAELTAKHHIIWPINPPRIEL